MRAGALDRFITIARAVFYGESTPNEYGVLPAATLPHVTMRAELLEATKDDTAHDSGRITKIILSFRLRYLADVKPGDRLAYDGRYFEILSVKEIGRRKGLEIAAIERPA